MPTTFRGQPLQDDVRRQVERAALELGKADQLVRDHLGDPQTAVLADGDAIAVVLNADRMSPRLWLLWVEPSRRGNGAGGALLRHIIDGFANGRVMRLDCPSAREAFYARHGFQRLLTAADGAFVYMAGPAKSRADVEHLLPPSLR